MKKIILILFISFFSFLWVFAAEWFAWNWKKWVSSPDDLNRLLDVWNISWVDSYRDSFTWLYWEKNPSSIIMSHQDAKDHCKEKWDWWRLPSIRELNTIVTYKEKNENNSYTFHKSIVPNFYWSNTYYLDNESFAFYVYFETWNVNFSNLNDLQYVICVK